MVLHTQPNGSDGVVQDLFTQHLVQVGLQDGLVGLTTLSKGQAICGQAAVDSLPVLDQPLALACSFVLPSGAPRPQPDLAHVHERVVRVGLCGMSVKCGVCSVKCGWLLRYQRVDHALETKNGSKGSVQVSLKWRNDASLILETCIHTHTPT